jgi:L-lactate utilization protein LutC
VEEKMAEEKNLPEGDMSKAFEEVLELLQTAQPEDPSLEGLDIDQVVERLEESLEQLSTQMEEVYEKTGMTKEQLEEYAANPENFSKAEWQMLEQIRGQLSKFREEADAVLAGAAEIPKEMEEEESKKGRRRRRKNWLQS